MKKHFTFHLRYKHSGTFANPKYEELSYPVRLHYSQSSRENATPSSGTSTLAYRNEGKELGFFAYRGKNKWKFTQ